MSTTENAQARAHDDELRHRRRGKFRPDALEQQYAIPAPSGKGAYSSIDDLSFAFASLDRTIYSFLVSAIHELEFDELELEGLPPSVGGVKDVPEWIKFLKDNRNLYSHASGTGFTRPKEHLREMLATADWAFADILCRRSLILSRGQPDLRSRTMTLITDFIIDLENYGRNIPDLLAESVEHRQFDVGMAAVFRRKWIILDSILDYYHQTTGTERRGPPNWLYMSDIIKGRTTTSESPLPDQLNRISSSLWLSLLVFLVSIPTVALAWQYSTHESGTPHDADFWFQIQNSCMTILNFAILAIPIWRSKALPEKMSFWIWVLLIGASLCVGVAPVIYLFGPTEWSSFMSIVAGIVQAFLTLQIALVADIAASTGGKSVKKD
ncbi:hypothetical protein ABVK25_001319 [Lepraria finkii]|uniref:Uncharacterized protein n=1 Tax=Lepraria finkii TaxID=1340010 RepID=A0ABR4BP53_9LECA